MVATPLYDMGDTVYLKESAAMGFLEAYIINDISYASDGRVLYGLAVSLQPPVSTMTMGDRNTGRVITTVKLYEADLINYHDAVVMARDYLYAQYMAMERLASE